MSHLAPFEKTFQAYDLVAYGAATWDWYDVHYDQDKAASLGLPAPFVDGQHFGAIFATQLRNAFGPNAFLQEMDLRFHALVYVGDTVRGEGEVTAEAHCPQTGDRLITLNQRALRGMDPVASATSTLRLPA